MSRTLLALLALGLVSSPLSAQDPTSQGRCTPGAGGAAGYPRPVGQHLQPSRQRAGAHAPAAPLPLAHRRWPLARRWHPPKPPRPCSNSACAICVAAGPSAERRARIAISRPSRRARSPRSPRARHRGPGAGRPGRRPVRRADRRRFPRHHRRRRRRHRPRRAR